MPGWRTAPFKAMFVDNDADTTDWLEGPVRTESGP